MTRPTPIEPTSWATAKLDEISKGLSTTGKKVRTKDALPVGLYPVVDQGTSACAGYLNDESLLVLASPNEPVILFGDHTRIVKFIEYPFIPGADGTKLLQPKARISPRYFYYLLNAVDIPARGYGRHFGFLSSVDLPLAPELEQQRIADKLDTVLTRVDAVNTRLARVAPILKRFRQSVLAAATSGRLTEDWRTGQAPDWDQKLFADVVVESSTGLVRSASEQFSMQEGLVPYLKMNSVEEMWGYECVDLPGVHCSAEEFRRYELRQGDWLFNTRNSVELVGKSCVWNGPAGVVFNNNLLRVRFKADINPRWVEIFFRSPMGRDLLAAVKSATTSVAAIYQRSLMGLPILRPPEVEQTEIIRRVETLFAFADRLEAHLLTAKTATERLTPALLAKAFRGELVPQDPNDEPASELLRRLQQEAPSTTAKRGRKSVV